MKNLPANLPANLAIRQPFDQTRRHWQRFGKWSLLSGKWSLLSIVTCLLLIAAHVGLARPSQAQSPAQVDAGLEYPFEQPAFLVSEVAADPAAIDPAAIDPAANNSGSEAIADLLQQGQQHYNTGQFTRAIELWQQATAQAATAQDTRQQAIAHNYLSIGYQALGDWGAAAAAIVQAQHQLRAENDSFLQAQLLNTQGNLQLQTGQAEAALATWQQAEPLYQASADASFRVLNQINQVQALQVLGYYRQAEQQLIQMAQTLEGLPDNWLKVKARHSLGTTLRAVGSLTESHTVLSEALTLAESLAADADATDLGALRLSLAKTLSAQGERGAAATLAKQVHTQSTRSQTQIEAALLQLSLWQADGNTEAVRSHFSALEQQLQAEPASRWSIYAQVNLAALAQGPSNGPRNGSSNGDKTRASAAETATEPFAVATADQLAALLANAAGKAKSLADPRAQSYALGQLGHVYEQTGQIDEALDLTQRALGLAQQIRAREVATRWHWQQGRLLMQKAQIEPAIAAYTQAVDSLENLQQDLVVMDPAIQFSYKEQVEPVYRQLVQILLKDVDSLGEKIQQKRLEKARAVIESLQLAELQNYFREACLTYRTRPIEDIDPQAAIVYPILLADRLEVIASIPNEPLRHYGADFTRQQQQTFFQSVNLNLTPLSPATAILPEAKQLYDWLVRPIESDLQAQGIATLVFVPDGFLRSVPMAILHDGSQYALEQYRMVLTPGMRLLNSQPLNPDKTNALTMGVSESRGGFPAIPAVEQELAQIKTFVKGNSLINEDFTRDNFFEQIQSAPATILHLATHGQFSSSVDDTFLLAWDGRINVRELDGLLRRQGSDRPPIELLVLSACQTASGDERAALGMAGIAVRSGARSTLATLWSVADDSTAELMSTFYDLLTDSHNGESAND